MQIKIRNYHDNESIMMYKFPQSKIKIQNQSQYKVKTQPDKYQNENPPYPSINEINHYEKIKKISLSLEKRNYNFVCKTPKIYSCEFPQNYFIWNQKKSIAIRRILPYKLKYEEKTVFLKGLQKDFQSKGYSERYSCQCRSKDITYQKKQPQSKTLSKYPEFEPKGWTNESSQSLL